MWMCVPLATGCCDGVRVCRGCVVQARPLVVDGSASHDPDGVATVLAFSWGCQQRSLSAALADEGVLELSPGWEAIDGVGPVEPCTTSSGGDLLATMTDVSAARGAAAGSVLELSPEHLRPAVVLTFSLNVTSGAGSLVPTHERLSTTSASLSFQPGTPPDVSHRTLARALQARTAACRH